MKCVESWIIFAKNLMPFILTYIVDCAYGQEKLKTCMEDLLAFSGDELRQRHWETHKQTTNTNIYSLWVISFSLEIHQDSEEDNNNKRMH